MNTSIILTVLNAVALLVVYRYGYYRGSTLDKIFDVEDNEDNEEGKEVK